MDDKKNTYNVDVVVTITLQAENQNDAWMEKTNNNFYPDWIGIRKLKYQ